MYQVQCINYAAGISKLTYANVLWLLFQIGLTKKWLDLPELQENSRTEAALIISGVLTVLQLVNKIVSVVFESSALQEHPLIYLMSKQTANAKWIPYQQLIIDHR